MREGEVESSLSVVGSGVSFFRHYEDLIQWAAGNSNQEPWLCREERGNLPQR